MKKLFLILLSIIGLNNLAFSQACEPSYSENLFIDDSQYNLNVWQCFARKWTPGFANCPHDFTDCVGYRYDGSYHVANGQSDGQTISQYVNDVNMRYIQMNRRKWVAFQGYVFDYLKVYINRWEPASHFGPDAPRQFCVPLYDYSNTVNLLDVCYWQTQVTTQTDPSGMHFQPIQQLPDAGFALGHYGIVTNFSFYYLDGVNNEVTITTPNALDLTPFSVSSTTSPVYVIYCKWTVRVDFDNGTYQYIDKSKPVFYFQCNSRPNIAESDLFPIVLDTIINTDPIYDITPHIIYTSPGVTSSWVLFPGEQAVGANLNFNPATYSTVDNVGSMIVQKISSVGCMGNTVVKNFTFLINPGTPPTPEIISKRFHPASYGGSNSLVTTVAPLDNLLLAFQESYAESEGIIGSAASYGVPTYIPPPGCMFCIAPYHNYISYSFYQKDSMGIVQRNATHLCTDKTYAFPVYNPSGSLTYEWESNRGGDWQLIQTGPTLNLMEPDSGIDRNYSIRVRGKNFLNVHSQPITMHLNFHTKYQLPLAVKDSACVDSSYSDNIPFSDNFYLYRDSLSWSDVDFADSLNSHTVASKIFNNSHKMLVFSGADTIGFNVNDSLYIGNITEGLHQLPVQITSYYPFRAKNRADNISPNPNGIFNLANDAHELQPHPLGEPVYDYGCVCLSYDTLTVIGRPEVSVTYTIPDSISQGYATVFTTTANNPSLQYAWYFSDEGLSYASNPLHYFYDIGPQAFSLIVTDQYGCSSVTTTNDITYVNPSYIGIEEIENTFSIFPNPTQSYININSSNEGDYSVILYNNLGQVVFVGSNSTSIDISAFSPGIYPLEINIGPIKKVFKIVKSNSN